jgi:hypothetical protein
VSFFEEHGKYFSVLEASSKGFAGFFTAYRKHYYKTKFEVIDNGRKLRPKTFLRQVTIVSNQKPPVISLIIPTDCIPRENTPINKRSTSGKI